MKRELTQAQTIERSIIKKFRKEIWTPFVKGVKQYELIKEGDKIAVCISGGKDSMLLAKLLQQLQRHSDVPFELVFLVMDPGYNEENMAQVEFNANFMEIPITVFKTDIYDTVAQMEGSPCYICARMRRGYLYKNAMERGCNKIALGHHFSDVVETTLMGMFYGAQIQAMLPKLHSANFHEMELIRPLYMVHENGITAWRDYNKLDFIRCACRFTEYCTVDPDAGGSKRQEIKRLLKRLSEENPNIERNIFKSIHNVKLDTLPGYKQDDVEYSFLDNYDTLQNTNCTSSM